MTNDEIVAIGGQNTGLQGTDGGDVLLTYTPDLQMYMASTIQNAYNALHPSKPVPTIGAIGFALAKTWIAIQAQSVAKFCGARDKLSDEQVDELATYMALCERVQRRPLTAIMLFFGLLKTGKYGHFYGTIDAQLICQKLDDFLTHDVNRILAKYYEQVQP